MRESSVETKVKDFCKENGVSTLKLNGFGNRGKADQLLMKEGVAFFLELKATGEKPTKLQLRFLQQRRDDGFHAEWSDNAEQAIHFIKTFLL